MKISKIRTTPLFCKFKQPYHWAQGVTHGAPVILIEIETDEGITGIAESVASPTIEPVRAILADAIPHFIGKSIYDGNRAIAGYYQFGFNARGTGSASLSTGSWAAQSGTRSAISVSSKATSPRSLPPMPGRW